MSTTGIADAVTAIFDEARDRVLSLIGGGSTVHETVDIWGDWEYVESRDGVSYRWPQGVETYTSFRVFRGPDGVLMALAAAPPQEFYGRPRGYYVVFLMGSGAGSPRPVVVFTECDDFSESRAFAAIIRGKGKTGKEMFAPGDLLPAGYERLVIETFRDRITGGYNRLAVIATSDDEMLAHAALQVRTRGLRPAQA